MELVALEAAVPPQPVRALQAALLVVVAEERLLRDLRAEGAAPSG